MSSDWNTLPLGKLGEFKNGANFSQEDYGSGYPIVNVKQLYGGRYIDLHNLESLGKEVLKRPEQLFLEEGDILFARSSVKRSGAGQCALVPNGVSKTIFSGFIIRYRLTDKLTTNPMFLGYLLQSPVYREIFTRIATGTTISNLSQDSLKQIQVSLPKKRTQDEVAVILGALDDRISLLRETNATLEVIVQAIFKSWFVDFDPVHAKQQGIAPEGMDEVTAALFPDGFEESELGFVPRGWEIRLLGESLKISYGKNLPTTKLLDSGFPVFGGNGQIGFFDKYIYETRQVLVSCRGAASGKVNQSPPKTFVTNNSLVLETSDTTVIPFGYLKGYMLRSDLIPFVTGSAQPQVTIDNLKNFKLLIPSKEVLNAYEPIASIFEDRIEENNRQAQTLATLRDTLLPRLISGQLRLPELEGILETVV